MNCPGSGEHGLDGRFPGDHDRCPYCGKMLIVREDETIRKHTLPKRPVNGVREFGAGRRFAV